MSERGEGPRPGSRDNGLRASRYVAVGDLDPRVADSLLDTLREEGIAAYVLPTPGARGGYLEVRLPAQPTDRLFVDESSAGRAAGLLADEQTPVSGAVGSALTAGAGAEGQLDVEAAWEQLLTSLRSPESTTSDQPDRPWPAREDVSATDISDSAAPDPAAYTDPLEDEHYEPPAPPPLPTLRPVTVASLLAIALGILVFVSGFEGGSLGWLGVLAIIGGAISLVWHVKDGPPTDSGWDDGAQV